ncbi:carbohydrate-binding family 9-like protein [Alkaliflexus imshenetskii]|uniref:carbohydrate-binding family 9-like protein n=1 Tax=Alkaliflexus imshenetskii TaxID=286730 RepID=UPI0004AF1D08|nr:carbohydrate-binding family 9-like protein [Alkaliflexus imshenetskii]
MMKIGLILFFAGVVISAFGDNGNRYWKDGSGVDFSPRTYTCYRATGPITIDGLPNEADWKNVPWTQDFIDIEGDVRPNPPFSTRAKMLWDDDYFYVAAEMEEPHIWAKITQRDAVIFHDNDFEVFIDPNGDTHGYYELEINALNTVWDLLLVRPYRDGGPPVNNWDINGLKTAVHIDGTLNNANDVDRRWFVEIAIPLKAMWEFSRGQMPAPGSNWRVNFSRVQWHTDVVDGEYQRQIVAETGRLRPEENWVWSPQGAIDMHRPEMWGFVFFSGKAAGSGTETFEICPDERVKWELRNVYYAMRRFRAMHHRYASDIQELAEVGFNVEGLQFMPELRTGWHTYEIMAYRPGSDRRWFINAEGRTWSAGVGN